MKNANQPLLIDNIQNDGEALSVILELLYCKRKEFSARQVDALIGVALNLSGVIDNYLSAELDRQFDKEA